MRDDVIDNLGGPDDPALHAHDTQRVTGQPRCPRPLPGPSVKVLVLLRSHTLRQSKKPALGGLRALQMELPTVRICGHCSRNLSQRLLSVDDSPALEPGAKLCNPMVFALADQVSDRALTSKQLGPR